MAQGDENKDDRTEEATPERRDEFRERGQIAMSKEISSVMVLGGSVVFLSYFTGIFIERVSKMFHMGISMASNSHLSGKALTNYLGSLWTDLLVLVLPVFMVVAAVATASTFAQTRFNWSWKKISPDFTRLSPLSGLKRMLSFDALLEVLKGSGKLSIIGFVAFLILKGEWKKVPTLMRVPVSMSWRYWGDITKTLFWSVSGIMLLFGAFDYLYNFLTYERQMKMTKQEVKEEYKKRELDPHIKSRMRRMQREMATKKIVEKTKKATVIITNPTHYSIALRYELGMAAPVMLAKGVDYVALRMREIAKENDIPIVENKPLARTLYKICEEDQEIPDSLYKAVSEVIRYVFNLKGIKVARSKATKEASKA